MDIRIMAGIIGALTFVGIFGVAWALLTGRQILDRGRQPREKEASTGPSWFDYWKKSEKVLRPLGEMIPRSPEEMSRQERRLVKAGIRRKDGALLFYGVKLSLAMVFFAVFAVTGYLQANPFLFAILSLFAGMAVPDLWLSRSIASRTERIQVALPDALDLGVVCVEAGLGLDQSLLRIGQEFRKNHPDLSDELNLFSLEVNAGKKRSDALRNLGKRTDAYDLKALASILIQTDRFGTSIAQSLRVFSDNMRVKRRQRAEERAAKMSIKMIPPLVFFILPATFVVILGPAIISIIRSLLPGLAK